MNKRADTLPAVRKTRVVTSVKLSSFRIRVVSYTALKCPWRTSMTSSVPQSTIGIEVSRSQIVSQCQSNNIRVGRLWRKSAPEGGARLGNPPSTLYIGTLEKVWCNVRYDSPGIAAHLVSDSSHITDRYQDWRHPSASPACHASIPQNSRSASQTRRPGATEYP